MGLNGEQREENTYLINNQRLYYRFSGFPPPLKTPWISAITSWMRRRGLLPIDHAVAWMVLNAFEFGKLFLRVEMFIDHLQQLRKEAQHEESNILLRGTGDLAGLPAGRRTKFPYSRAPGAKEGHGAGGCRRHQGIKEVPDLYEKVRKLIPHSTMLFEPCGKLGTYRNNSVQGPFHNIREGKGSRDEEAPNLRGTGTLGTHPPPGCAARLRRCPCGARGRRGWPAGPWHCEGYSWSSPCRADIRESGRGGTHV
ncbi:hypothetical protein GGR56DRAFT_121094 [Xylariaceae sp. FL0804]|nr:hypothetical protein GGR56DRAFT_121094 [Xylariaceae sp. FL0804]